LFIPIAVFAQQSLTSASVAGRLLDPSGAVVPNATVTALQLATNQSRAAETDSQGRFHFSYLPVGQYRISAQGSGFAETTQIVELTVGAAFDVTLNFALSQAATSVQVTAQPPMIETERSQIGQTVSQSEITQLPFEGRNYLDLALLLPGVSP